MEGALEDYVSQLKKCVPSNYEDQADRCLKAKELTNDIREIVKNSEKSDNKETIISVLLDENNGLPVFLSKLRTPSVKNADCMQTATNIMFILELILVEENAKYLSNHLVSIKNSLVLFMNSKNAAQRTQTFSVLCNVVNIAAVISSQEIIDQLVLPTLCDELFLLLSRPPDSSTKTKKEFLVLIGRLAQHFPNALKEKAGRIILQIVYDLEIEVKKKDGKDSALIEGSLESLTGLLYTFSVVVSQSDLKKIHEIMLILISKNIPRRSTAQVAAINKLLVEHTSIFSKWLLEKYDVWFNTLKSYALHTDLKVNKGGLKALEHFIDECVKGLKTETDAEKKSTVLEFFVRNICEIMESSQSSLKLRRVGIKSLGECSFSVSESNASHIFEYLLKKATLICIEDDTTNANLDILPVCLESLGLVLLRRTSRLKIEQAQQLQKMCVYLITRYLDIAEKKRLDCGRSIAVFLTGIRFALQNPLDFSAFVGSIVTQGLIRCSRPDFDSNRVKKHVVLWTALINFTDEMDLPFSLEERIYVSNVLETQLIIAVSTIVRRLNFLTSEVEVSLDTEEKVYMCRPQNPADWILFQNLVDLLEDVLKSMNSKERLKDSIISLGGEIIELTTKYPAVPGLYRLAASILSIIGEDLPAVHRPSYQFFISNLINQLAQFSDEILFSAVQAILASPTWLVTSVKGTVSGALTSALKIGLTYLPMAEWPLNALEHWQATLPFPDFESIMENILPYLEPYLSSAEQVSKEVLFIGDTKLARTTTNMNIPIEKDAWNKIQRRVMRLLGRMGPKCSRLVSQNEDEVVGKLAVGWQINDHLDLNLPLADMTPKIQIDVFLPRVLHLVQHSSDLKVRMPACEFLHASVTFLTGTISRRTEEIRRRHSLTPLYSKLFPAVLNLAVDADDAIKKLFHDLLFQLVHWFSRPTFQRKDATGRRTLLGEETALLVEQLMESACSGLATSLVRDLACDCLREFLYWSIRHVSDTTLWEDPAGPDFLFQKLRASATHPSPQHRLGAAFLMIRLYPLVRDSDPLASIYTLDLLAHFIVSLSLAERDASSLGTVYQINQAIYHLNRTVFLRKEMFSTKDSRRRVAPFLVHGTLPELLEFLLKHAFGIPQHCRQICVDLCSILIPPESFEDLITKYLTRNPLKTLLPKGFPLSARLDTYRWLLHYRVIETNLCDTDAVFLQQFESFAQSAQSRLERNIEVSKDVTSEDFLSWLNFLLEYLSKSKKNLFVHAELLVHSVLLPSTFGFSNFETESRQQLYGVLEKIFPLLTEHKEEILSVLTRADFQPDCLDWTDTNSLDILHGLVLIVASGCLDANVSFCKPPNILLKAAVDIVMKHPDDASSSSTVRLKTSIKLVELALLLGLKMEILSGELKNPDNIPDSVVTYGQSLRSKLERPLFLLIFRQLEKVDPFLPEIGNGDSQQWALLLELLQAAQQAPPELDTKKTWIVQSVLDSWNVLERHADSYDQRVELRLVVEFLVNMNANLVGQNISVKNWITNSWNHPITDISFASGLVQLLIIFSSDCSEMEEKILTSSLEQFFTSHFPSKTSGLETDSDKSSYFSVINRMVGIARVPVIFQFLIDIFALEPGHSSVGKFIEEIQTEGWMEDVSDQMLDRALNKLFQHATTRTVASKIRMDAIDMIYVPLLEAVPSPAVERHLKELLGELNKLEEESRSGIESYFHKTAFCSLLAVAIGRVDCQRLTGCLNADYCALKSIQPSNDGKDLLKSITRIVLKIRKIAAPLNETELDIFQNMQGSAFNLMLAVVTVTSVADEENVDKLLFKPMSTTNPPLWNAVVGTTKRYKLIIDIDPKNNKLFTQYKSKISLQDRPTKGYIPSQFMHDSSLSEDVHRFDFNQASMPESGTLFGSGKMSKTLSTSTDETPTFISLTLDELNEHHCMKPLVFFLQNLHGERTSIDNPGPEPKWMKTLREVLLLPNIHNNVTLFIVRLVINLKSIFQSYAKSWYYALLLALLRKTGGEPLNNLFRECLAMMLEWSSHIPPPIDDEFAKLASSFVQFIIKNMDNSKNEITRNNLDMVKTVLGVWEKIPMDIPHGVVDEILSSSQNKDLARGLQVLDAITFHGFLPVDHEYRPLFKQRLIDLLNKNEKRSVTRLCGALCGSFLLRESDKEFEKRVSDTLQKWVHQRQSDVFVDVLYEVATRYPGILSKLASANLSFLGGVYGSLRAKCLENLAISWQFMEDPWKEIGFELIESVLKGNNPAELCPVLLLLKHLIPRVEISQWKPLWPTLVRLSRHKNVECRSRLHEVFKKALDLSDPLDPMFAQAVLRACKDEDQELSIKMENFVAEKLPNSTTDRLLTYVTDFYYPGSEEHFLPYCSHFLLERTTQSQLYRDPIFDQPLEDIPFEVFDLASLSSQSYSQKPSWNSFGRSVPSATFQFGYLRATQQSYSRVTPSLTQAPANWLMSETQSGGLPSTSHSPIKTGTQTAVTGFKNPIKSWKQFDYTGPPSPRKSSYASQSKRTQTSQPMIYRKYRKGELPDIEIPPSALIAPLQAVALQDPPTAKILFGHLLSAIRKKVKEIQGRDDEFTSKLNAALVAIITSNHPRGPSSSTLIAAAMEYIWTNAVELSIDTELLARIAKQNNLQPLGILVLESSLPHPSDSEKSKRTRRHEISRPSSCWFNVADLYGDIGNVDCVRAVVKHLTSCNEHTKMAIESEAKSDWDQAFRYYSEVLKSNTSEAESKFCNEYRLRCLEELGKWDEINRLKPNKEPWNIRSRVRSLLQSSQAGRDTYELDRIALPTVDPALLPDLALSSLLTGNKTRATHCISKASDNFISRYSQLSPLNFGGRQRLLQQVCIITELESFTNNSGVTWNASLPQTGDDLVAWNSILALRTYFAQFEERKRNKASESVSMLRLRLADTALDQKNVGLARKLVGIPLSSQHSMFPYRKLIQSKVLAMDKCDTKSNKIDKLILAKETINNNDVVDNSVKARWRIGRERFEASLCAQLFQVTNEMQPKDLTTKQTKLIELWNVPPNELIREGLKHARHQAEIAENQMTTTDLAESHYILAKYCHEWKSVIPGDDYATEITKSILASMRHGSVDGQALFPLVIVTLENNFAAAAFESNRSHVPLSMFLPWVNQLVSYFTASPAIARLLIDIAKKHPTHVRVPFGITKTNLNADELNMNVIRTLESILTEDRTYEMFLKSIDYLHPPEIAAGELLSSETFVKDFPVFKSKYLNLSAPTDTSAHGQVHYAFSTTFTTKFQEAFHQGKQSDLTNLLHNYQQRQRRTTHSRKSLRDYSPWLASYRLGDNVTNELEIPSLKGNTLKVEAFRDDIQYLESKQLPVRLTLVVNGAQEFPVLIKHGEDVRQDERIVQLLNIIDTALVRDVDSRKRNLRIRTFQVIPLTTSCGMFQWLTDTLTLKAFLETDLDYRSSSSGIRNEIQKQPAFNFRNIVLANQDKLTQLYSAMADKVYRYGLRNALQNLSQSPEAFYYLRNRTAASNGVQCSALWILGVGDRHLKNFLVSTKNGDVIGIDYGYAFGTATFRLAVPEIVPCRLTTQFQYLIPGLGLNGPVRESMIHTLRVAKAEYGPIIAALSVFVTEPTLDWLSHTEEKMKSPQLATISAVEKLTSWLPKEIVQRTENLLSGVHPSEITCQDLRKNQFFSTPDGQNVLSQLLSIVRGKSGSLDVLNFDSNTSTNKRRSENISFRENLPSKGLSTDQQVDCLIEQSTDPLCLSRMYVGWEPWV